MNMSFSIALPLLAFLSLNTSAFAVVEGNEAAFADGFKAELH